MARGIPVEVQESVAIRSATVYTKEIGIPGIVYASQPSAAGDTLGSLFEISVPTSGIIQGAMLFDRDNEGLRIDVAVFKAPVTLSADNAAWALDDVGVRHLITVLEFTLFVTHTNCQTAELSGLGVPYIAPNGVLYVGAIARGASNIAVGSEPMVQLRILSDDPSWTA